MPRTPVVWCPMMSSGSFNPDDFMLVPKPQFDLLVDERDMLLDQCDRLSSAGDQLVADVQELMKKFKMLREDRDRIKAENDRLSMALAQRMPRKKKKGEGVN